MVDIEEIRLLEALKALIKRMLLSVDSVPDIGALAIGNDSIFFDDKKLTCAMAGTQTKIAKIIAMKNRLAFKLWLFLVNEKNFNARFSSFVVRRL